MPEFYRLPEPRRQELFQQLRQQDNPAATAFVVAFCLKYPQLVDRVMARNGRIDKTIFQGVQFRPTLRSKDDSRGQWDNWDNELFEEELRRFKQSQEGE